MADFSHSHPFFETVNACLHAKVHADAAAPAEADDANVNVGGRLFCAGLLECNVCNCWQNQWRDTQRCCKWGSSIKLSWAYSTSKQFLAEDMTKKGQQDNSKQPTGFRESEIGTLTSHA